MEDNPYSDIIDLPHPTSLRHPRMSMRSRAAQFAPFAALTGYEAIIDETARFTTPEMLLDEEAKSLLDSRFAILNEKTDEQPFVTVTYFVEDEKKAGGKYVTVCGNIRVINIPERFIEFTDRLKIQFRYIYSIESDIFRTLSEY